MIKQLTTKVVYKNRWLSVREDFVEFPNGHTGIYSVVDKCDFSMVIPFDGTHFTLVSQYRYPTGKISYEFPCGRHEDDPHMDPKELAKAELLEETGLSARSLLHIGYKYQAPGMLNQGFNIYFATGLTQSNRKLDVTEAGLETLKVTIKELEEMIVNGQISDCPTITSFALLKIKKLI